MITKESVVDIQNIWGSAIIKIGSASTFEDAKAEAQKLITDLYDFNNEVLFKPTRATSSPFRKTSASAVSYFVGKDTDYPEDKGFALEPWTGVKFKNSNIMCFENLALAMGHYIFTNKENKEVIAEYSFAYKKNDNKNLKIVLHHSSLPFIN